MSPGSSSPPGTPRPIPQPGTDASAESPCTRHSSAAPSTQRSLRYSELLLGPAVLDPSHLSLFRSVPCEAGFMDQISHSPCQLTFRWIPPVEPVEDGREGGRGSSRGRGEGGGQEGGGGEEGGREGGGEGVPPALLKHLSLLPSFPPWPLLAPSRPS